MIDLEQRRETPAQTTIAAFGGIRPTARAVNKHCGHLMDAPLAPSTVLYWGRTGYVISRWHRYVLFAAQQEGCTLTATDLVLGREIE